MKRLSDRTDVDRTTECWGATLLLLRPGDLCHDAQKLAGGARDKRGSGLDARMSAYLTIDGDNLQTVSFHMIDTVADFEASLPAWPSCSMTPRKKPDAPVRIWESYTDSEVKNGACRFLEWREPADEPIR